MLGKSSQAPTDPWSSSGSYTALQALSNPWPHRLFWSHSKVLPIHWSLGWSCFGLWQSSPWLLCLTYVYHCFCLSWKLTPLWTLHPHPHPYPPPTHTLLLQLLGIASLIDCLPYQVLHPVRTESKCRRLGTVLITGCLLSSGDIWGLFWKPHASAKKFVSSLHPLKSQGNSHYV